MKEWLHALRFEGGLWYWYAMTAAGIFLCKSARGFLSKSAALKDMRFKIGSRVESDN